MLFLKYDQIVTTMAKKLDLHMYGMRLIIKPMFCKTIKKIT
jgi:hypothetical protein